MVANANDEITETLPTKLREAGFQRSRRCTKRSGSRRLHFGTPAGRRNRHRSQAARIAIYRMMRPGEPPTEEAVEILFNGLFI